MKVDGSDESLMLAYAGGDLSAFAQLYDRHERALHRYFLRHSVPRALADDLLQETFVAVIRSASRYTVEARFSTWLFTIARSKLVDHWRSSGQAMLLQDAANDAADDDGAGEDWIDRIAASRTTEPETIALSREYAQAFVAAVEALPLPQREAFLLKAEGGLSIDEIAGITAVGIETVRSRLRYATRRLRAACADWLPVQRRAMAIGELDEA